MVGFGLNCKLGWVHDIVREVRITVSATQNRTGDSTGLVDRAWLALLKTSALEAEGLVEGSRELCLLLR